MAGRPARHRGEPGLSHRRPLATVTSRRAIALRFARFRESAPAVQYECHDDAGRWWRSYGNELWEFTDEGLMRRREASINDLAIDPADRRIHGPRPEAERGMSFPLG